MVAAGIADKGIQQSQMRSKELAIHLCWVFEWTRCREKENRKRKFKEPKKEIEIETEF